LDQEPPNGKLARDVWLVVAETGAVLVPVTLFVFTRTMPVPFNYPVVVYCFLIAALCLA
jgi:hypothetical protein